MTELDTKHERLQELLHRHHLDAIWLRRASSFAWATGGANAAINTAATEGVASLLVTRLGRLLITNTIEAPRFEREDRLGEQGWQIRAEPWWRPGSLAEELTSGARLGSDLPMAGALDLGAEIARLRARLTPEEQERFRKLGRLCAEAMGATLLSIQPGQTEHEIAGRLASETLSRGVEPIVQLVATDQRISWFRHPLPTDKPMERYAMVVLCGRRWGLVCSMTRLVHVGEMPAELRRRAEAVARVDASMIDATRPGHTLGHVFRRAAEIYAETGFDREWTLHHQGGLAGYEPRELLAHPESEELVEPGQAFAWNPSIAGAKSEDTILVGPTGLEILTWIPGWPSVPLSLPWPRPAVMERP